jgi:ParB family chromosome partitioning protein
MSKRALGRGIDALLLGDEGSAQRQGVTLVPLGSIRISGTQPRKAFPEESLRELARSIEQKGVLQPILVEPSGEGEYLVVAGERRFRAARLAGLQQVPALVRSFSELEKTEIALIENLQREDLTAVEEALGYKTLMEKGKLTQEQVAARVGKNRSTVANSLRLLKLPDEILQALDRGQISAGHGRAILSLPDPSDQQALFRQILQQDLSVREAEDRAAAMGRSAGGRGPSRGRVQETRKSPELLSMEQRFVELLGTRVLIRGTENRGRIEISYFSMEDLDRIYLRIAEKP